MDSLIIPPSELTPKVVFDPESNKFEISGESRPDDSRKFFDPLKNWLKEYNPQENKSGDLTFEFMINYFNSSSKLQIVAILQQLFGYHLKGTPVKVKWKYEVYDEDTKEIGEELSHIVNLPFEFIAYE